jgi:hypothetical protein
VSVRGQIKSTIYGSLIWRVFIGAVGGLVTIVGALLLFAPGPGLLVLLAGLGILASEFAWASRAILKTKTMAIAASDKVRVPLWIKFLLAASASLLSIIYIFFNYT